MQNSRGESNGIIKHEGRANDELAAIVAENPYYSVARFRLLAHVKKDQPADFQKQAAVAALFFNSQRWLSWQLSDKTNNDSSNEPGLPPVVSDQVQEPPVAGAPANKNAELIPFEPLHTVDYFASQGIKISEDPLTNDKLGTQLKSFTEWLRSMKKIHIEKRAETDEQTDKVIQHMAEISNANINVNTEAMAEVLLNQGKIDQAIDIYNILSLNNPSQSAYFTAKINRLKPV